MSFLLKVIEDKDRKEIVADTSGTVEDNARQRAVLDHLMPKGCSLDQRPLLCDLAFAHGWTVRITVKDSSPKAGLI